MDNLEIFERRNRHFVDSPPVKTLERQIDCINCENLSAYTGYHIFNHCDPDELAETFELKLLTKLPTQGILIHKSLICLISKIEKKTLKHFM